MQAGAMELPRLRTSMVATIIEGQNGTIIPVKDSDALYLAMNKVVEVVEFRTKLQQNSQ
jgi:hypothetical protein